MLRMIYLPKRHEYDTNGLIMEQLEEQMKDHKVYKEAQWQVESDMDEKLKQVMQNLNEWIKEYKKQYEEKECCKEEPVEASVEAKRSASNPDMYYDSEMEMITIEKPKDWAFMKQSDEVLREHPATWMAYPNTEAGAKSIIDMEYCEYKGARTLEEYNRELVHLASACLLLWRKLNHVE